jgi:membrane associated rhomboid family serine protease
MNFLINSICIMILCSTVESSIGAFHTAIIYLGGGVMGALFGAMAHCCTDQPYLETPAGVYALLGSLLGV